MKIGTMETGCKERDYMIERYFNSLSVEIHGEARDDYTILYLCKKQKDHDSSYQASTIFMGASQGFIVYTEQPATYYKLNNKDFLWLRQEDFVSVIEMDEITNNKERAQLLRNVEED